LAIYALATRNKSAFLRFAVHLANGTHVNLEEVRYFRTQSGSINTVPSQDLIVDGEFCFQTPQVFGMNERALSVVVPQEFNG
jgi:diacylglycerol kinase family enzyme